MLRGLPCVLLLSLLAAPSALADATLLGYHLLPTEHDDLGRSDEPDRLSTGVLGIGVENCIVAFDPLAVPGIGRGCVADSALPPVAGLLAPGCTDDAGRQASGLCGLWSNGVPLTDGDGNLVHAVPPGTLGTSGMSGNAAPGAFTPTKGRMVRFLDIQVAASVAAATMVDTNRKLGDLGVRGLLGSVVPGASGPSIPNAASLWAWYGVWQDKNGNGVVDHLTDAGQALPANEFQWVGSCLGSQGLRPPDVCRREPGLVFPVWVYPGNHHQECGILIPCYLPADMPGRQALCFASFYVLRDPTLFRCLPFGDFDAEERDSDPLLGPGDARVMADGEMGDGTGEKNATLRLWDFGLPPGYYYDQSLLTTTVVVGGPTLRGRDNGLAQGFDLAALQFLDVDAYAAWLPEAGDLLRQSVQPSARQPWVLARDLYPYVAPAAEGIAHQRGLDAPSQGLAGPDDALRDPGWSREPNHPLDRFPGAGYLAHPPGGDLPPGEQEHRGWRNDHAGNAAAWHAWADLHAQRLQFTYGRFTVGSQCPPPCAIGGGFWDSWSPGPAVSGDHGRSLGPGAYQFRGFAGAWRDQAQAMVEQTVDLVASVQAGQPVPRTTAYVLPPDGWVGNIVNTTGAFRYRGYDDAACFLEGREQTRAWAVCNPYLDSDTAAVETEAGLDQSFGVDLSDPQDVADATEFQVLTTPPAQAQVLLRPAGGVWTFPVFVWRDFYHWRAGDAAAVQDLTGTSQPIALAVLPQLEPALRSRVVTQDVLLLPEGNLGAALTSTFAMRVRIDVPSRDLRVDEDVTDVDAYRAWGSLPS